jgi:polyisoprenoid-binding protein YceI
VFAIVGVLTPSLAGLDLRGPVAYGAPLASGAVAIGLGVGLLAVGDGESGRLELPDVTSTPAAGDVLTPDDVAGVTYVVVPGESTLTYTVREKQAVLPASNDAVGQTTDLSGTIRLGGEPSEVSADMSTLESDQSRRDSYVQTNIFQTDPIVTFVVDELGVLPDSYTPGETVAATVTGTATVRGVERPLTFEVEARLDGETLQIVGRTDFTWADFEITPPNTQFITVEDNVHIEVLLIARPGGSDAAPSAAVPPPASML